MLAALLLVGCTADPAAPGREDASGASARPSATATTGAVRPCAVAGSEPRVSTSLRRGTRVAVYALPVDLVAGERGRVPVVLRRVVDLRPGVRAPVDATVDPDVLRRVAAALPGSTGPLSETFATRVRVGPPRPRPRRVVAYAVTRARPLDWSAEVCGPPTTTDGSRARVEGTGLTVGRFATGRLECTRVATGRARPGAAGRQVEALC